ncbi:hypothetical protein LVJ94_48930 [Pendulispora rubella]|uniref:Uncharacterized protein n=1 Tax=Pendulispora rubella TaxID=2741070 RepID=A0ABZ2L1K6_9BACT
MHLGEHQRRQYSASRHDLGTLPAGGRWLGLGPGAEYLRAYVVVRADAPAPFFTTLPSRRLRLAHHVSRRILGAHLASRRISLKHRLV